MKTRELCDLFGGQRAFARACKIDDRDVRRRCKDDLDYRPSWEPKIIRALEVRRADFSETLKKIKTNLRGFNPDTCVRCDTLKYKQFKVSLFNKKTC